MEESLKGTVRELDSMKEELGKMKVEERLKVGLEKRLEKTMGVAERWHEVGKGQRESWMTLRSKGQADQVGIVVDLGNGAAGTSDQYSDLGVTFGQLGQHDMEFRGRSVDFGEGFRKELDCLDLFTDFRSVFTRYRGTPSEPCWQPSTLPLVRSETYHRPTSLWLLTTLR